ncbi:hypothetical protein C8Q76DRAFT_628388 [Earliella scabrosa]|nr:hypothetical protein C8Q76DRAFT_628388 [Earliella scabrosa]
MALSRGELPPEILLQVFDLATYIPGAYTHNDGEAFVAFTHDYHGISVHRRHREATDTMLAACLVCKSWSPLALELLFKYILVKSGAHAMQIAAALELHASRIPSHASSRAPGHRAIRLELALEGVHVWTAEHTEAIRRVVAACPHLSVLSTAFYAGQRPLYQHSFLDALLLVSNIRRLELRCEFDCIKTILHPLSPSLESIWLLLSDPFERSDACRWINSPPMDFPRLQHLVVIGAWSGPPPREWFTPVLRTLCIYSTAMSPGVEKAFRQYLQDHGERLRHFSAHQHTYLGAHLCPNLAECILSYRVLSVQFPHQFPAFPSLRRITFDGLSHKPDVYVLGPDLSRLTTWLLEGWAAGLLTSLEAIRFLLPLKNFSQVVTPRAEQVFETFVEACRSHGVALEASLGADEHTANIWQPLVIGHL